MRVLLLSLLGIGTGCILPGTTLTGDNEPSSETGAVVDTADNVETGTPEDEGLDLALSTEVNDGHGTAGMHDWHLIFDGELALERRITTENNEFKRFLQPDTGWGFAATIAPYNEDVEKFMFGEGDTNGEQFVLFQTNNAVLSMQFVAVGGGNSDPDSMVPEIQYDIRDPQSKQVCMSKRWKKASGDTFFIPTRQDLFDGFQMLMTYKSQNDGLDAGPTLHLRDDHNGFYLAFDEPETFEFEGCPDDLNTDLTKIVFGQGTVLENSENNGVLHHFRGRVDDLLFFKLEKNDFAFGDSGMLADVDLSSVAFDLGTESYLDEPTDDGVAWFPFHKVAPQQESNQVLDASSKNQNGLPLSADLCRIEGEERECDLTDGLAWTEDHYRKFDQNFEDGVWHEESDSEPGDVFAANMQFMSGTHLVLDGTYFLFHEARPTSGAASGEPEYGLMDSVPFLSYLHDWGVAFKWAPNSQGVSNEIFGTNALDGEEIMLFRAGNNVMTIRFVNGTTQNHVVPQLSLKTISTAGSTINLCRQHTLESQQEFDRFDLEMGMKLAVVYQNTQGNGSVEFQLNGQQVYNNSFPLNSSDLSCPLDNTNDQTPNIVEFGFIGQNSPVAPIRGRIDDLLIMMVGEPDYSPIFNELNTQDEWGQLSASTTSGQDNLLWWNFDQGTPSSVLTEAHHEYNTTIEPFPYEWFMKESADPEATLSESDASSKYHNDGTTGQ